MSKPTSPPPSPENDDLLAAEFVLGLLEGDDWRAARDRAATDGAFAARVQAWEERLAPLNAEFDEAPAPDLLPQIENLLFGKPRRRSSLREWFLGLAVGTVSAVVLLLAVFVTQPPVSPTPPSLVAQVVDETRGLSLSVAYFATTETLDLQLTGPTPEAGQDYELWVIDDSGTPRSLGVLTEDVKQLEAALLPGEVLAISLEPAGGSPEPVPTGPVLGTAVLEAG